MILILIVLAVVMLAWITFKPVWLPKPPENQMTNAVVKSVMTFSDTARGAGSAAGKRLNLLQSRYPRKEDFVSRIGISLLCVALLTGCMATGLPVVEPAQPAATTASVGRSTATADLPVVEPTSTVGPTPTSPPDPIAPAPRSAAAVDLPVVEPDIAQTPFDLWVGAVSSDQLHQITDGNEKGLLLDLKDPNLWGTIYTGPYPFEAGDSKYAYAYYGASSKLAEGKGVLPIASLYNNDANSWRSGGQSSATPTIAYRLELFSGSKPLGTYGSFVSFERAKDGVFHKLPTIVVGPLVTSVSSDDPTSLEIVWETDESCAGRVRFGDQTYDEPQGQKTQHLVKITGLTPQTVYTYVVESTASDGRKVVSDPSTTRTAPVKGEGPVVFAYGSDSYDGVGGGDRSYMGVNRDILSKVAMSAYQKGAQFFLFGGDLVTGMTSKPEGLAIELKAWKEVMGGFWRSSPVYTGMGNHEFNINAYKGGEGVFIVFDKWPYTTESSEAVFAAEMFNPTNGPALSDPRRPSYAENVYRFQYGPALIISLNNSYWNTGGGTAQAPTANAQMYGGAPSGYVMEDQLRWLEEMLTAAEQDATVTTIFLFAHTPVFPYMSHVGDSMWWQGNNAIRAYTKKQETGKVEPESLGMLEVRDRMWTAIARSTKVAAFLTSHEHGYYRMLIDKTTPVGVYPKDDTDGDGVLNQYSPNPNFTHPTWHILATSGSGPYNAETPGATPWTAERVTSQPGYVLIKVEGQKASLEYIGAENGEALDTVQDLMAVK